MDLPFDLHTYEERKNRVLADMASQHLDALIVSLPDNIFYLSGFDSIGYLWFQALIISPSLNDPVFITRDLEEGVVRQTSNIRNVVFYDITKTDPVDCVRNVLEANKLTKGRIGVELDAFTLLPSQYERLKLKVPKVKFVDASPLVAELRVVKSPQEIAYQRQAGQMADYAMGVVMDSIRAGMTEAELAGIASKALGEAGSEISAITPLVQSGRRTTMGHALPANKAFTRGEIVVVEFAGVSRRYHAPILRTAFIGNPPTKLVEDVACLAEAVEAATESAKAGTRVTELTKVANKVLQQRDLAKYRVHRIGYSIGIAYPPTWLEPMVLAEPDKHILEPNMSFTIEPNIKSVKEDWGFKLGDTVLCTAERGVALTNFPRELHIVP